MKQVSLIWSLLIILIIFLESMNTASALKCYECDPCAKGDKGNLNDCPKGKDDQCLKKTVGDIVTRQCVILHNGIKDGECIEVNNDPNNGNQTTTACFCTTDGCDVNSSGGNGNSSGGNGAIPLGQMSLWLFLTLSIMVPWVSRTLFAD